MVPLSNACGIKILLDNFYTLGKEGLETPETVSDLIMKNGYVI